MGNRVSRITDGFSRRKKKETGHDPVTTSAALTDRQYNTDLYIPQVASDTAAKLPTPPAEPVPATESEQLEELFPHEEALEDAATKIQANYKGYKARKEIKELKSSIASLPKDGTILSDITAD
ncbi:immunoglobulin A1 protease autotransporter isoform X5 [Octopus vulgaris]|uniref:Immunoglobulin A1 protease autotransporter isoform X5 n=1 Tax=Octopus vulgaris TaxID=6645 RepID=A0AA36BPH7_OCTVU|nr:immunoglobulin A1 protease autotransporter isoform X5 [Octopus vulgaris]